MAQGWLVVCIFYVAGNRLVIQQRGGPTAYLSGIRTTREINFYHQKLIPLTPHWYQRG